jgi:hypothetical protein
MPEVGLQRPRIMPFVGEGVAAGVPKHVGMRLEAEPRLSPRALDHTGEASGAEGRASFRSEHKGRLRLLVAL